MEIEITYTELAGLIATVIFLIGMLGIVMVLGNKNFVVLMLHAKEYSYVVSLSDSGDFLTFEPPIGDSRVFVSNKDLVLESGGIKIVEPVLSHPQVLKNET